SRTWRGARTRAFRRVRTPAGRGGPRPRRRCLPDATIAQGDRSHVMAEPAKTEPAEFATLHAELLVGGKYRLVEQRGTGAMGAVWGSRHVTLGHEVAFKFLHGSVMTSEEARERFEREARLAARLGESSRHITRVIDH